MSSPRGASTVSSWRETFQHWRNGSWVTLFFVPLALSLFVLVFVNLLHSPGLAVVVCAVAAVGTAVVAWINVSRQVAARRDQIARLVVSRQPRPDKRVDGVVTAVGLRRVDPAELLAISNWAAANDCKAWMSDSMSFLINQLSPRHVGLLASAAARPLAKAYEHVLKQV